MSRNERVEHNLLRAAWAGLDSFELRLLLASRFGGLGQYRDPSALPGRLCLPLADETCRVEIVFDRRDIVRVEPGPAFDPAEWTAISDEIETAVLAGPAKYGRDVSFSTYRVDGGWVGVRSGLRILPAPDGSPQAAVEFAEHPFVLEFPVQTSGLWEITNSRRTRSHRRLTRLLNVLLAGRTNVQPTTGEHLWVSFIDDDGVAQTRWAQRNYFAAIGEVIRDTPTRVDGAQLAEVHADEYFTLVRGLDGKPLRVPTDLDNSICRYLHLDAQRRADFDRAAFWFDRAARQRTDSISASFAALVSSVEALINERRSGSTDRFKDFLERFAPGLTNDSDRRRMYDLRSAILHGSELLAIDDATAYGWDPPALQQRQLYEDLSRLTKLAARNWLHAAS